MSNRMLSHPGLILTGSTIRRFNGNESPCHIGWVSLVTPMTDCAIRGFSDLSAGSLDAPPVAAPTHPDPLEGLGPTPLRLSTWSPRQPATRRFTAT